MSDGLRAETYDDDAVGGIRIDTSVLYQQPSNQLSLTDLYELPLFTDRSMGQWQKIRLMKINGEAQLKESIFTSRVMKCSEKSNDVISSQLFVSPHLINTAETMQAYNKRCVIPIFTGLIMMGLVICILSGLFIKMRCFKCGYSDNDPGNADRRRRKSR